MALARTKKKKLRKKLFSPKGLSKRKFKREEFSDLQLENFRKLLEHDAEIYLSALDGNLEVKPLVIGVDEVGRGCVAGPVCTAAYSCTTFYKNHSELIAEVKRSRQLISDELLSADIRDAYYSETVINDVSVDDNLDEVEELSTLLSLEDSKKVSKTKRELLCRSLLDVPSFGEEDHLFYHVNFESAKNVDKNGIVASIWTSMRKNLQDIIQQYIDLYNQEPEEIIVLVDGPKTISKLDENIIQIPIIKGDSKSSLIASASNLAKLERDRYMEELSFKRKYSNYTWARNVGYGTKKHIEAILEHGLTDEHRKSFLGNYITN